MLLEACEWSFAGCICNTCFTRLGKQFFQKDDMNEIYHKIKKADIVVVASQVYFYGISAQLKAIIDRLHAPLPIIDAENGGVSVRAVGCEQYMSILRYGQYGQVGADGVWRNKEKECKKTGDKSAA